MWTHVRICYWLSSSDLTLHVYTFHRLLTPLGSPRAPKLEVAEKAPPSSVSKRTIDISSSTTRASRVGTIHFSFFVMLVLHASEIIW
jgi:hypothetical protein